MWVKVDDGFPQHPKVVAASRRLGGASGFERVLSVWLQVMCFTNRHLTDGFISNDVASELRGTRPLEVMRVLAHPTVRLLDRARGGWRVHDYHDYQPSSTDVKDKQTWDRQRKALYATPGLVDEIRHRDGNQCRYCGRAVNWKDRRSELGGTYDHVVPRGPNTLENVVVSCLRCTTKKGHRTPDQARMPLLAPGTVAQELVPELVPIKSGPSPATSSVTSEYLCDPDPIRSSPSRPLRKDQKQRADARPAHAVLERLAHDVLTEPDAESQPESELVHRLKDRAAAAHLAYDGRSATKALESARVQQHRRHA